MNTTQNLTVTDIRTGPQVLPAGITNVAWVEGPRGAAALLQHIEPGAYRFVGSAGFTRLSWADAQDLAAQIVASL